MPYTLSTKRAFEEALKKLMADMPFEKISVSDICSECGMSRKSFYYHFRDKYDLVNWIFDRDFSSATENKQFSGEWEFLLAICRFLYEKRGFYRKAFRIKGQNSLVDHFKNVMFPVVKRHLITVFGDTEVKDFHINYVTDANIVAILRWIMDRECIAPEEFVALLYEGLATISRKIAMNFNADHAGQAAAPEEKSK